MNFEDRITLYHNNADGEGKPWNEHAVMAGPGEAEPTHMASCGSDVVFKSGTRHAKSATIRMTDAAGRAYKLELRPQWNFYMSGLGYTHPVWGHGRYHGDLAVGYDAFETAGVNESELHFLHVQAFSHTILTGPDGLERKGCGVLEQLIIGAHKPSGFTSLLDGAK
jgi:hypothetical protein